MAGNLLERALRLPGLAALADLPGVHLVGGAVRDLKLGRQPGNDLDLVVEDDVLGVEGFATHHLSLDEAPDAYARFQKKQDGTVKVVFRP